MLKLTLSQMMTGSLVFDDTDDDDYHYDDDTHDCLSRFCIFRAI